jgi:hypothetical protein
MQLETWKRLFDLIHSSKEATDEEATDKDSMLLNIAEDALLSAKHEEEREAVSAFIMYLLTQTQVELPDPTETMYYAQLVARHTPIQSPNLVSAMSLVIEEARKDDSDLSEKDRRAKFCYLGDAVAVALGVSGFRKKHPDLHSDLFSVYLDEALKIAVFNTVLPIKSLTVLFANLPSDTNIDVKNALSETIVEITKNAAESGPASLRQSQPRGPTVGMEAQAQA